MRVRKLLQASVSHVLLRGSSGGTFIFNSSFCFLGFFFNVLFWKNHLKLGVDLYYLFQAEKF